MALLAIVVVAAKTAYQLHLDFNIADESFLWYGMQRTLHGEVPLRDYMAYDPGRYYWGAAWMYIFGSNGIIAMRVADAMIEALGFFLALLVLSQGVAKNAWLVWIFGGIALSLWMMPRYKVFDHTASIALIASLAYLIQSPSRKRFFVAGLVLGIAAMFGRNHALYGMLATGLAVLYIYMRDKPVPIGNAFVSWLGGVLTGYSPVILMMLFVPGFAKGSMDMVRVIMQHGTNLPLPTPWPWNANPPSTWPWIYKAYVYSLGVFFVLLLAFGVGALIYVFWRRWKARAVSPALVSCAVLCLPYAHYAFSRADVDHLSFGGFPLFLGLLIAARRFGAVFQTVFAALFLGATYACVYYPQPGRNAPYWVKIDGTELRVTAPIHTDVVILDRLVSKYAPNGRSYVVVPFWPGAYPMYQRKSPVWDLYSLFPRDLDFQNREIADIEHAKPGFILIVDEPPDSNGQLLFRNTNPHIMSYIRSHYVQTNDALEDPRVRVWIPKVSP